MDYKEFLQVYRECCDDMSAIAAKEPPNFDVFSDFVKVTASCGAWDSDKIQARINNLLKEANRRVMLAGYLKTLKPEASAGRDDEPQIPIDNQPAVKEEKKIPMESPNSCASAKSQTYDIKKPKVSSPIIY